MPVYRRRVERAEFIEFHGTNEKPWPENLSASPRLPFAAFAAVSDRSVPVRNGDFLRIEDDRVIDVLRPKQFHSQWEPEPETS